MQPLKSKDTALRRANAADGALDIFVITPWFPNRPGGWPAPFIAESVGALAEMGHRVRVAVLRGIVPNFLERFAPREHQGKIDTAAFHSLERLETSRYLALPRGFLRRLTNLALDGTVKRSLQRAFKDRRPDVLIVHSEGLASGAVEIAGTIGLPVIVVLHGENTNREYISGGQQVERFRRSLSAADRLVIVGEPLRAYAAKLAGRADHVCVVWNGVRPPPKTRVVPVPDCKPLELITVSNLQEGKGVDLLVAALHRLCLAGVAHWRLTVIGEGPEKPALRHQVDAANLGDHVRFLGAQSNTRVLDELAQCDVFVLPSYREAFGVAYLEAMAAGLLTVGVRGQGPAQFIVDGETGLLVEPRSVDALVQTLEPILQQADRTAWRRIAAQGASYAATQATWQAHASRMTDLIRTVVAENTSRPSTVSLSTSRVVAP
ncbi:glycosyltransferase [Oryzicola mucosus]|uniref:Glycosyltransferase n=1 Tax=Oryzicola mucosus TaxID=2767425 RepID=A0A8J6PYF1_9HYPH|nr:glycosyltransferase [Oryzicola mucosus]MBD0413480.1 glycosyltransferase [Oryzicola mucosus]